MHRVFQMKNNMYFLLVILSLAAAYILQTYSISLPQKADLIVVFTASLSVFLHITGLFFIMCLIIGEQPLAIQKKIWLCLAIGSALFEVQKNLTSINLISLGLVAVVLAYILGLLLLHVFQNNNNAHQQ